MLKLLAALLMVIDHAALVFLPASTPLYTIGRLIGRLSMPLFAYSLANGFIHTKHFKQYVLRITLMTLAAQIPFTWLLYGDTFFSQLAITNGLCLLENWNIGLTFLCALLILKLITTRDGSLKSSLINPLLIFLLLLIGNFGDYGIYGIGMILIFYTVLSSGKSLTYCSFLLVGLTLCYSLMYGSLWQSVFMNQLPAVLSLFLIAYVKDIPLKLPRHFFYSFYPLHMLILLLLKLFLS